jgi:16S rRNA (guanine966-N2)-methyltransferase
VRIIAGEFASRRIVAPRGRVVRPTSDRVRESLFAALGDRVTGARVLDLFAGSGALGLEALSRGADHATFCDAERTAIAAVRQNVAALGVSSRARIVAGDARRFLRSAARQGERYTLILLDPPYAQLQGLLDDVSAPLDAVLASGGAVVVEQPAGGGVAPPALTGVEPIWHRTIGAASMTILTRTATR